MSVDTQLDHAAFAKRWVGYRLWPHQLEVMQAEKFITVIAAARRTGKTVTAEVEAIRTAVTNRNCRVIIVSATQDAARRLTEDILGLMMNRRLLRDSVVDGFSTRIRLTNGSEIISLPPSPRQIRGFGKGVLLAIVDESGFVSNEVWTAIHYTCIDERANGSRVLLIGTPWGTREAFFRQMYERGLDDDPDVMSFHWKHTVNPLLDHEYLTRQRDRVSWVEYASEVLGEWVDEMGSFFRGELLDAAAAPIVIPEFKNLKPPARGIVGTDYGVSFDRSAVVAVYRVPCNVLNPEAESKPRFVAFPYVYKSGALLSDVVDDVFERREAFRYVSTEQTGVGAGPTQQLYGMLHRDDVEITINRVATTANKKMASYSCVLRLLERGQLILPKDPDLLRQMRGIRFEQGARSLKLSADNPSVHDDVADALALAALPFTRRRGELTCKLGSLSSPKAYPDANVSVVGPTVTTGSGLKVWEQPPLQSVAGMEISYTAVESKPEPIKFGSSKLRLRSIVRNANS